MVVLLLILLFGVPCRYLTMLQMAQFVSFIGQAAYHQVQSWVYPGMYPDGIDRVSGRCIRREPFQVS